jgi:4-diphosphocytidyl-2-C-methyl-D-erythritol kinase
VRVRALAKINLALEVLNRRADGYHNLRTVFQTISLADTLQLEFTPGRRSGIELQSAADIPNNLALRAAELVFSKTNPRGHLSISLFKKIPMGGGLGGGSSDAAAILLALPVLTGRLLAFDRLLELAGSLGSDVPFFLHGGTALGLGRGTELYPLPEVAPEPGLLITPALHVSTPEAYKALNRTPEIAAAAANAAAALAAALPTGWHPHARNDFEAVVFAAHPEIRRLRDRLRRSGASVALMSGSGASVFGLFSSSEARDRAAEALAGTHPAAIALVSRRNYRKLWWRQLAPHLEAQTWPPRSRYAK